MTTATVLPASMNLRTWAMPVGNQGAVGSCVTWAINYGMLGWYSKKLGRVGQPFAPMYTYSQIHVGGGDNGSYPTDALAVAQSQGSDTKAHYSHGDFDWQDTPERGRAGECRALEDLRLPHVVLGREFELGGCAQDRARLEPPGCDHDSGSLRFRQHGSHRNVGRQRHHQRDPRLPRDPRIGLRRRRPRHPELVGNRLGRGGIRQTLVDRRDEGCRRSRNHGRLRA